MRDPLPLVAAAVVLLAVLFLGWSWFSTGRELSALEPQLEQARQENQRFRNFVAQKRKVELIRDSLVAQIKVLQRVDGERYVWPHVMDEVTRALPPYTWLVDLGGPRARPRRPGVPAAATGRGSAVADTAPPVMRLQINGPDGGRAGLHPVPPAARGLALDHRRAADLGADGRAG